MVISFFRRFRQAAPFPVSSFTPVASAFLHTSITPVCSAYSGLDAYLIIFARLAVLPLFSNLKQRVPLGFCLCLLSLGEGNDHVFPLDFLVKCFNRARLSIRKHHILGGQTFNHVGCVHANFIDIAACPCICLQFFLELAFQLLAPVICAFLTISCWAARFLFPVRAKAVVQQVVLTCR